MAVLHHKSSFDLFADGQRTVVGLIRSSDTSEFYWHDGTPYDTSLADVIVNNDNPNGFAFGTTNFNDIDPANTKSYLCQANLDNVSL